MMKVIKNKEGKSLYIYSASSKKKESMSTVHHNAFITVHASNKDEADGMAMRLYKEHRPESDGWINHRVSGDLLLIESEGYLENA